MDMKGEESNLRMDVESESGDSCSSSELSDSEIDSDIDSCREMESGKDEYDGVDSSDEEDGPINRIGENVPIHWYEDYSHIGYDSQGKAVEKVGKSIDEIDGFLSSVDNPHHNFTVKDPVSGSHVLLSDSEQNVIRRLHSSKVPDENYQFCSPWNDFFSSQSMDTPIRDLPDAKKSFLPSNSERLMVSKMVHSIKMGWMKINDEAKDKNEEKKYYMMWSSNDQIEGKPRDVIPPPKMKLPDHAESYNPPPEYLFNSKEEQEWSIQEPYKRKYPFIPQKYNSLRSVPAYKNFINERFERCMDLHLAPRARKMRLTIQAQDLVPVLTSPRDLLPYPRVSSVTYVGHKNMIRTLSVEPICGQFMVSGSDDSNLKFWEVSSGYCLKTIDMKGGPIKSVEWCPNPALSLVSVTYDNKLVLICPGIGDESISRTTNELCSKVPIINDSYILPQKIKSCIIWNSRDSNNYPSECLIVIEHFRSVSHATWHAKGDYFSSIVPQGQNRSVFIHQLSKWRSQIPFSKSQGLITCVKFHPSRPYLFVSTQRHIRIYNLVEQKLSKKLTSGAKWISSFDIHPHGDNLIVSTFDKRVIWFDLDLSTMPYQVLRMHTNAVRGIAYHQKYPLFASCSDDEKVIVCHGKVYNDYLQNPTIVPLKQLHGHTKYDDFGVMAIRWHPSQPWLFSAGADGSIRLWT